MRLDFRTQLNHSLYLLAKSERLALDCFVAAIVHANKNTDGIQ